MRTISFVVVLFALVNIHSCYTPPNTDLRPVTPIITNHHPNCTFPANGTRALLVLDMQNYQATTYNATIIEDCMLRALNVSRDNHILIVYTGLGFRPGYPEISPNNIHFETGIKDNGRFIFGNPDGQLWPPTKKKYCEPFVIKKRYSGFGTDLEIILRSNGIKDVYITGIKTSGTVLQTATEALDKDFRVTIIRECVTDADTEAASVVLDHIMPDRSGAVISISDYENSF